MRRSYQSIMGDTAARYHFPDLPETMEQAPTLEMLSRYVTGPVVLAYVWWVLREADARGFRRLYFLARDGFLLREIAACMCREFSLNIDCRYLYCSRAALRSPGYWFLGEEAFDLLLQDGYYKSMRSILARGGLTEAEQNLIFEELKIDRTQADKGLGKAAFEKFAAQLRQNDSYKKIVLEKSKNAYPAAIGYLRQEGLLDQKEIAIVDSGWIGSMQRSLRQLLQHGGWNGNITGFYFGLFRKSKDPADGTYLSWYFDEKRGKSEKIYFCNNLFECMLSAPHGMTTGYCKDGEVFRPVMNPPESKNMLRAIHTQIDAAVGFAKQVIPGLRLEDFDAEQLLKMTRDLLKRLMYMPTEQDVAAFREFEFSDDITNSYQMALVSRENKARLRRYLLLPRIWEKLTSHQGHVQQPELFWVYGAIALLPAGQAWYRANVFLWEWLRYTLKKL